MIDLSIKIHKAFSKFIYQDTDHRYYNRETGEELTSVTTFIKGLQQKFAEDYWLKKKSAEYNCTIEELKDDWYKKRVIGTTRGTIIHKYFESAVANKLYPVEYPVFIQNLSTLELIQFHKSVDVLKKQVDNFLEDHPHLIPIKSELVVGDEEIGISGQIDQIFWNEEREGLEIWDLKNDKKINIHNQYQNFKKPLSRLSDCEYNKYSLQTSLYRYIFEKAVGVPILDSYCLWLNFRNPNYEVIKLQYLEEEIKTLFK